ncbi:putative serine esterase-domain-containing protein [Emericellopsis atlantica]|uniref:Serine esterase-domain-containing protein n=1 Tax=Emericellopsis atlantica TaxID=2614577 RepID=A0A9P7ZQA5_9HYPO|nr:putative serine esterase-domain-containing protein [Emericellopsis atlantica]KAG9255827.1 putative serine esterase-domain-containing protein [Emericellopsis atlantica]
MEHIGGSPKAQHLCVLVHGLWGNPNHMNNIAKSLRATFPPEELYLLLAKRNSGSFTYDGIERGGERVCHEIEEEMKMIEEKGGKITKLSIIGYSLGGLVSRYAVGLLEAKGILDRVECMNFTTFATPHLGVRSPLKGWHNHVWNVLGARTLSMSGRQLFIIDQFRDTGRPLLAVLADPKSIFMSGMRKFKRHTLYCNIVNDRSAVYYTTGIQKTDPYRDLDSLKVNWVEGYDNVILDPANPYKAYTKVPDPTSFSSLTVAGLRWLKRIPFMIALGIFVPIGVIGYLLNSIVQNARSSSRIKLYEKGHEGVRIEQYRVPVLLKEMREEVEQVFETINSSQEQEYLRPEDESDAEHLGVDQRSRMKRERRMSVASEPTLALAPAQFEMIDGLDTLNWRKYPVWIQRIRHSHAAIIVRMDRDAFSEGKVVLKHYAQSEFLR